MPVPTNLPPSRPPQNAQQESGKQPQKNQKTMTKAERRELQERQRAAKAEKQATGAAAPGGGGKGANATPVAAPQQQQQQGHKQKQPSISSAVPPNLTSTPKKAAAGKDASHAVIGNASASGPSTSNTGDDVISRQRGPRIFAHFGLTRQVAISSKSANVVHPEIIRLGLQFSEFKITGANARCIATLNAFKSVIQDYTTPINNTLSRHLMTHLSPQITHLVAARPMSVTMGNAIRQLKLEISNSDIDMPEQDAKDELCTLIDNYIRDRIIVADEVIIELAGKKIKDGDTILTYARSSIVEKVLLRAHAEGKKFSVIVVDSRPMLEGKRLLKTLASTSTSSNPIQCTYLLLPALPSVITETTTVFLGAHSLHSNGAVYSRAGTALVAMLAKRHNVPVVVCCETYKYAEGVQLDGFTKNELAPSGDLFSSTFPLTRPRDSLMLQPKLNLEILNPLYDLTPPANVTVVVTEVGLVPASSISSIPLALGRQMI